MPLSRNAELAGRIDELVIDSDTLRGNPLGDPASRPVWVYTPPGYDGAPQRRYPSIYLLHPNIDQLAVQSNRNRFRRPFPAMADELFASGMVPPCIIVYVDAWTAYGGGHFMDSPAIGRYHSYLCEEIVPFVDSRYRTLPEPAHRGLSGRSSGGFSALITPMLRPDLFGGLASHSADSLYEMYYLTEFAKVVRALRDEYDGSYERFWADFRSRPPMSRTSDAALVMVYGCAAAFSAAPDGSVRLPFDHATGQLVPQLWQCWLDWDPVRMVPRYAQALRGLRAIYLDADFQDECFLDLGAAAVRAELTKIGITDVHFELFEATHQGADHRYLSALRYLAERLSP